MSDTPKNDAPFPVFPFSAFAPPENLKKASEQAMSLWIGALSPMWVPFLAASGFGLTAYAAAKSLQKDLLEDMPAAAKWPGFASAWGQSDFTPEAFETRVVKAAQAVEDLVAPVEAAAESLMKSGVETMVDMAAAIRPAVEAVAEAPMEIVPEIAPEIVSTVAPEVVTESAVVAPETVVGPAEVVAAEPQPEAPQPEAPQIEAPQIEAPKTIAPKPIANELAVARAKAVQSKPVAKPITKPVPANKPKPNPKPN